jgi:ATP-dependent RNA helicase DDX55/SPB4
VLIGTPGRLDDILQRCAHFLDLRSVEVLVLDEADRLLDMGFRAQLDGITARLPRQRRTGLFSATQTEAVGALARAGLRNPIRVNVAVAVNPATGKKRRRAAAGEGGEGAAAAAPAPAQVTPSTLSVHYTLVDPGDKVEQLAAFLSAHAHEKLIVYFLTCACVDFFAAALPRLLREGADARQHQL